MLKKMLKLLSSRLLYVFLGLFLALSIFVVQAAWNDHVNSGQTLTMQLWNDVVDELIRLNQRIGALESGSGSGSGGAPCNWTGEKAAYGDAGGCFDDIHVVCDGTKVTRMFFGC